MARSDLELGAEWAAKVNDEPAPRAQDLAALTDTYTRQRTSERATKVGLDAGQHRWLAEQRERVRIEDLPVPEPVPAEAAQDDSADDPPAV